VLLLGKDGRPLGRGYFSTNGPIAVRMLTTDRNEEVPALVRERLDGALAARRALFESGETTAFRWVHGEGDRLPGLNVDVYARHASVFFDGPGARAFYLELELPNVLLDAGSSLGLASILERARRRSGSGQASVLAGAPPSRPHRCWRSESARHDEIRERRNQTLSGQGHAAGFQGRV
jgi:23S rRNA G2069 N7-methylase RlmK/C1962 C5-methylase RlmI